MLAVCFESVVHEVDTSSGVVAVGKVAVGVPELLKLLLQLLELLEHIFDIESFSRTEKTRRGVIALILSAFGAVLMAFLAAVVELRRLDDDVEGVDAPRVATAVREMGVRVDVVFDVLRREVARAKEKGDDPGKMVIVVVLAASFTFDAHWDNAEAVVLRQEASIVWSIVFPTPSAFGTPLALDEGGKAAHILERSAQLFVWKILIIMRGKRLEAPAAHPQKLPQHKLRRVDGVLSLQEVRHALLWKSTSDLDVFGLAGGFGTEALVRVRSVRLRWLDLEVVHIAGHMTADEEVVRCILTGLRRR